jgi:hypothetical protein
MLVLSTLNQFDTIIKSPLNGNNLDILNSCRLRNYLTYVEKRELVRVSVFLCLATNDFRLSRFWNGKNVKVLLLTFGR